MARTAAPAPPQGQGETTELKIRPGSLLDQMGAHTEPDQPKKEFGKDFGRAARSIWWQCRKGMYPVFACGGLAVAAHTLHENGGEPIAVLGGTAAVAVGCVAIGKVRTWLGKALWRRNWAAGALGLATVWTAAAVEQGVAMNNPMPTLLVVGGSLVAAPWWYFNRPRPAAPAPPPQAIEFQAPPAIEEGPHADQLNWEKKIKVKVLKGTVLLDREQIVGPDGKPNGSAWTIDGAEENTSSGEMFQQLEKIKGAFDRRFSDSLIYIEPSPEGWKTRARLILLERNPLKDVIRWERPLLDRETGILPFAVYPDGSGWANYTMFKPKGWGTTHDLFAGGTGSGKTTALNQLAIESMAMGNAVLLFDPYQGADFEGSRPYFTESFLNMADIFCGMFGLEAVQDERMKIRAEVGGSNFDPDHGFPIIHAIFDEAKEPLADPEINRIMVKIVSGGRKVWLKMSLALQVPSVENLGEGGGTIREQLTSGNTLLYRITQRTTGTMAYQGNLPIDPLDLPEFFDGDPNYRTVGLGYVLNGMGRALQSRSMLVEDEMFAKWIKRIPQMDPRSAEAFRRGVSRGLQVLMEKRPALVPLLQPDGVSGITPPGPPEPAPGEPASQILTYLRARGTEMSMEEIAAALQMGAGTTSMLLGDLTTDGQLRLTEHGYTAVS